MFRDKMLKKAILLFFIIFPLSFLWGASVSEKSISDSSYDSLPMLEKYYISDPNLASTEKDYWNKVRISLVTVSKEDPVYSWFGHQALLVEFPDRDPLMFDYGHFAFSDDFYLDFAMGRLWYWCSASSASFQLYNFDVLNRSANAVELNFNAEQKKAVVQFLYTNITEENRTYLYHYYKDNCATRIRDIIDYALDGEFKKWAEKQNGYTFREETSRMLYNSLFWISFLDFLQGSSIDEKNTFWDSMFLPENLEKAVLSYPNLALSSKYLLDNRDVDTRPANAEEPQKYTFLFFLIGTIISLVMLILHYKKRTIYNIFTFITLVIAGLFGLILFFIMFFTSHDVAWWNENIIFINPLLILMGVKTLKSQRHVKFLKRAWCFFIADIIILIFVKQILPTVFIQSNYPHIFLMLPIYAVNFYLFNIKGSERLKRVRRKRFEK